MLNGLDLFSGIAGITLGLQEFVSPIAYCEKERWAQACLLQRMHSGDIPQAPIWDDVTTLNGKELKGQVDIIYGGFPCQDISCAGNGAGLAGKRSGLFYEIVRLTREIRPQFVFLENVPAIRTRGLLEVVRAFADIRYDCRWTCVSAAEVGAPHLRKRWFLLAANSNGTSLRHKQQWKKSGRLDIQAGGETQPKFNGENRPMANSDSKRQQGKCLPIKSKAPYNKSWRTSTTVPNAHSHNDWRREGQPDIKSRYNEKVSRKSWDISWATEPDVGRVVNGVSLRVDRIRGLGNAVVPLQVRTAFVRLLGIEEEKGAA